jgi:hypothetical protein
MTDRDRILEKALKHELRGEALLTSECVDAETLAAWQDGALDAGSLTAIESHVSSCARCQAMLGAFARGTAGALGSTPDTSSTQGAFRWWRWWLAPIAAGAAAVTLWMVVPEEQQELATRPAQPPAAVSLEADPRPTPPAADKRQEQAASAVPNRDAQAGNRESEAKVKVEAFREDRRQLKDAAAPKERAAISRPAADAAASVPAAPPSPAAAREDQAAAAAIAALQKSARLNVAAPEIVSPDPASRWRVAAPGIERSEDGGQTWSVVLAIEGQSITVGASPARTVAWLAGRAGVVLVTSDGSTFARVNLPEVVDIAAITAADARSATVTTVDGRRFRTNDGGRTWRAF